MCLTLESQTVSDAAVTAPEMKAEPAVKPSLTDNRCSTSPSLNASAEAVILPADENDAAVTGPAENRPPAASDILAADTAPCAVMPLTVREPMECRALAVTGSDELRPAEVTAPEADNDYNQKLALTETACKNKYRHTVT